MRKKLHLILLLLAQILILFMSSCSKAQDASPASTSDSNTLKTADNAQVTSISPTVTVKAEANMQESTAEPETAPVPESTPSPEEAAPSSESSTPKEATATEEPLTEAEPNLTQPPLSAVNFDPTATISDSIPEKYLARRIDYCGTIEMITYDTYDYFGDNSKIQKSAFVYLPYGYDESKKYNVLYLMHGIGGNEREWGMVSNNSTVKILMDNLIYYGDIEPFIIVTPNGRSSKDYANTNSDFNSFYKFGLELRNDLIPYMEANYSTYAEYDENGYDMTAAREHRAMAGLSMGAMQTINIGLCECLDIISYFGAFSACPTTYTSSQIASHLKQFEDYDINYFYNICGTADGIAITHARNAVSNLTSLTDKLKEDENFLWQEIPGGNHDFKVWYLAFYNFAQLVFK